MKIVLNKNGHHLVTLNNKNKMMKMNNKVLKLIYKILQVGHITAIQNITTNNNKQYYTGSGGWGLNGKLSMNK